MAAAIGLRETDRTGRLRDSLQRVAL